MNAFNKMRSGQKPSTDQQRAGLQRSQKGVSIVGKVGHTTKLLTGRHTAATLLGLLRAFHAVSGRCNLVVWPVSPATRPPQLLVLTPWCVLQVLSVLTPLMLLSIIGLSVAPVAALSSGGPGSGAVTQLPSVACHHAGGHPHDTAVRQGCAHCNEECIVPSHPSKIS